MLLPDEMLSRPLPLPGGFLQVAAALVDAQIATGQPITALRPYNWQALYALAYLPAQPGFADRAGRYAAELRTLYGAIRAQSAPPDNRLTHFLAETFALLRSANRLSEIPGIEELLLSGSSHLRHKLESYADLTHFTSSNCGTGTNHVAVYLASVYRVGQLLNRPEDCKLALDVGRRLMADQHPDGYWPETTGGPSVLYNHLTVTCAGRMARWTGEDDFLRAMLRGAEFQRRMSYPDGTDVETVDGRCRYHALPMTWGGFPHSDTAAGQEYMRRRLTTFARRYHATGLHTHGGENVALLCENHALWQAPAAAETAAAAATAPAPLDCLGTPAIEAAVRRDGPWCFTLNGLQHLPRGYGNFTIDRASLFSLWHADAGLIVNGSGEPDETPAQSFHFKAEDTVRYAIPEIVRIAATAAPGAGASLTAEYRGGTGRLELQPVNDREFRLQVRAATRLDRYPVRFTLQLELHAGDTVNGAALGEKCTLAAAALSGQLQTGCWRIEFPAGQGEFLWPHDPYNPYDVTNHRSDPDQYVALLSFNLGREPIELHFHIATASGADPVA